MIIGMVGYNGLRRLRWLNLFVSHCMDISGPPVALLATERNAMLLLIGAIICVLGAAVGQILFKAGALSLNETGTYLAVKPLSLLIAAFAVTLPRLWVGYWF